MAAVPGFLPSLGLFKGSSAMGRGDSGDSPAHAGPAVGTGPTSWWTTGPVDRAFLEGLPPDAGHPLRSARRGGDGQGQPRGIATSRPPLAWPASPTRGTICCFSRRRAEAWISFLASSPGAPLWSMCTQPEPAAYRGIRPSIRARLRRQAHLCGAHVVSNYAPLLDARLPCIQTRLGALGSHARRRIQAQPGMAGARTWTTSCRPPGTGFPPRPRCCARAPWNWRAGAKGRQTRC